MATTSSKTLNKLTPAAVKAAESPSKLGDGGGLWLQTNGKGQQSWIFRFTSPTQRSADGVPAVREMGLGPLAVVGLAAARKRRDELRALVHEGRDPLGERDHARKAREQAGSRQVTFSQAAEAYIAAHGKAWSNPKHAAQWSSSLAAHAFPTLKAKPVANITTEDVRQVMEPLWGTRTETAMRVRGRIEMVLAYSKVRGWRPAGENPAQWRGNLALTMTARAKAQPVEHHAALPWTEAPAFLRLLEARSRAGALALRFAILTAARSGEVRGAPWSEMDLEQGTWTVPKERMKARKEHRVPLSEPALAILRELLPFAQGPESLVFVGLKPGRPLSDMSLTAVLRRMGRGDLTAHGFRSTFRDWAAETGQPADVAEAALAHVLASKVQAAYQRGDMLDRRRILMIAWADYLTKS